MNATQRAVDAGPRPVSLNPVTGATSELRRAYGCFPTGVTAVCGLEGDEPVGMAASTFAAVSMEPALLSVCFQSSSSTWPRLRALPRLGISVLGREHPTVCRSLAAKDGDRFAGVGWVVADDGDVFVDGAVAWFSCTLHDEIVVGDHVIAFFALEAMEVKDQRPPLVFHGSQFRELAAQPNAWAWAADLGGWEIED